MLYKFKSRATADLILLDAQGRRLLAIVGKDPAAQGIITVAQIPAAIAALEAAVVHDERDEPDQQPAADTRSGNDSRDEGDEEGDGPRGNRVTLRQRAAPFIDMLQRSAAEDADVVWGT